MTATAVFLSWPASGHASIFTESGVSGVDTGSPVAAADLSIAKTHSPTTPQRGEDLTYTVKVTNAGPDDASNVVITDPLPAGVTYVSAPGCTTDGPPVTKVTCTKDSLPATTGSNTASFDIKVQPTQSGALSNTASVTSDTADPDSDDLSATDQTTVEQKADLAVSIAHAPDHPALNGEVTYFVGIENSGPFSADNVSVSDVLPAGVHFVSASPGCSATGAGTVTVTCTKRSLAQDEQAFFRITAKLTHSGPVKNTVSVSSDATDTDATNDSASDTIDVDAPVTPPAPSADLGVRISRNAPRLVRGIEAVYTLGAVNHGPSTATGARITVTLPNNVTFVSASSGCTRSGATVACPIGNLASGARASRSIRVRPNRTGTTSTHASIAATVRDPDTADNSDADTAYVEEPSASRGRLVVCRVGHAGSMCTVRYDGRGRPAVTGSLRRGSSTQASGSARRGRPLRLRSRHRVREGKYTLVRTYNGRRITFDAVYVVVVR